MTGCECQIREASIGEVQLELFREVIQPGTTAGARLSGKLQRSMAATRTPQTGHMKDASKRQPAAKQK